MGELHLDIIIDRLKREFNVECNQVSQVSLKSYNTINNHREVGRKSLVVEVNL